MSGVTTLDSGLIVNGVPIGGFGVGNSYFVCPTATTDYRTLMWERYEDSRYEIDNSLKLHTTLADAYAATTSGRNDTVYVVPSTYTHTSVLTWANSNTHLIGLHSGTPWSNNVKIQHTSGTAVSPVINVTGSDNHFKGLHFVFGGSDAAQHIGLKNAGSGNHYENCWFEGPTNGTQADDSAVETVQVDGGGNYFKNCIFGTTAVSTNAAALLGFTGSAYRTTFENCIFYHIHDGASAVMIDLSVNPDISGPQFFKGCQFVGWSQNWATKADILIRTTGVPGGGLIFDPSCMVVGFTDIGTGDLVGFSPFFFGLSGETTFDGTYSGLIEHAQNT